MEVHSPVNHVSAKRLWNTLRIAFFMLRKGLISKRKLLMDMHLMMKRGKVYGKSLGNLIFHHSARHSGPGYGLREYEFSCSNSPAFHMAKRKHHYFPIHIPHFPCIHPQQEKEEEDEEPNALIFPQLDCNAEYFTRDCLDQADFPAAPAGRSSPMRISICSADQDGDNDQVDRRAEEFIARFYEQLRLQHQVSILQYQEMLARGAS